MSLTILTSERKYRRFLVYDLEWVPVTLTLRLAGLYDGNRYQCFHTIDDLMSAMFTRDNRGMWFYAHAGGLYDIQWILHRLKSWRGFKIQASFSSSSAIIVHITHGKNSWHLCDSYWLLRESLSKIGTAIGMDKGGPDSMSDDWTEERITDWYANVAIETLRDYNAQDCRILWHAIDLFQATIWSMGGQLQMTLASSAMNLFRRSYLAQDIETDERINQEAIKSYFSSRVEVFASECWDAKYYDINSSFPYSMTFPAPGACYELNGKLPSDMEGALYLADLTVTVPESYIPPLPYRAGGRCFFPTGTWRGNFMSEDVKLLLREGGTIEKVWQVWHFEPFHDLAEYAKDIYARRLKEESDFGRMLYKLLGNSLYGKFAESLEKRGMILNPTDEQITKWDLSADSNNYLFPGCWFVDSTVPIPHRHVPLSSHITALSRRLLYDLLVQSQEVHYCDTDGFSTADGFDTGKELGQLKLEKTISHGVFLAPKLYRLIGHELDKRGEWKPIDKVKAKGFSLGKKPADQIRRFEAILEGCPESHEHGEHCGKIPITRMVRIREGWDKGLTAPHEKTLWKGLAPVEDRITKRSFYPDGSTRPYHVSELDPLL